MLGPTTEAKTLLAIRVQNENKDQRFFCDPCWYRDFDNSRVAFSGLAATCTCRLKHGEKVARWSVFLDDLLFTSEFAPDHLTAAQAGEFIMSQYVAPPARSIL